MKKTLLILITGLAFTFIAAYSFASQETEVEIHGFVSQGFISSTENNFIADSKDGSFEFNEAGINFSKKLTSKLHIGMQLFAKDFGEIGNNEIKLDWAFADYRLVDWLGLRFGQLKAPHGLYNEYRDIDALRTFIFLPQSVYPEITREVSLSIQGGGLYGNIGMDALGLLSYQAYYGTQTVDPDSRLSEYLGGFPQADIDNQTTEVDTKYVGSLVWDTPLKGVRVGVSYSNVSMSLLGHWNKDLYGIFFEGDEVELEDDPYETWVYSLEFFWQNLVLMAEYMDTRREVNSSVVREMTISSGGNIDVENYGWYVGAAYRFTDWFELGAYYSLINNESLAGNLVDTIPDYYYDQEDVCVTTRFDINEYWTLKLEYHDMTGAMGLSTRDNPSDDSTLLEPKYFKKDWTMFAAKLTVAF